MSAAELARAGRRIAVALLCAVMLFLCIGTIRAGAVREGLVLSGGRLENRTDVVCKARVMVEGPRGPRQRMLWLAPGQSVDCLAEGEKLVYLHGWH